jgi:hypothetical protein
VGLAALIAGQRANNAQLRTAGFALLLAAVGKVFLYDLSTLTSVYRVASFIVLGLLLLAGAFAYQRLRPPPLPDMRTLHPSQRRSCAARRSRATSDARSSRAGVRGIAFDL